MISFIHGTLSEMGENHIVVEAGGVGYGINVPMSVLAQLPTIGEEVKIYTHYSVREDGQSLYGFLYKEDREMFRQLLSVNGVGPKGALGILSVLGPDDLRMAIITGDAKAISRASPSILRKISAECPPPPKVNSTYRPPAWISKPSTDSFSNTGT